MKTQKIRVFSKIGSPLIVLGFTPIRNVTVAVAFMLFPIRNVTVPVVVGFFPDGMNLNAVVSAFLSVRSHLNVMTLSGIIGRRGFSLDY